MAEEKKEKKDNTSEEEEHECEKCPPKGAPACLLYTSDAADD